MHLVTRAWQRQEMRYLVVGAANTAVGLGLYAAFHALLGDHLSYLMILVPSWSVGIVVSFITMRYVVFGTHGHLTADFARFTVVQLSGLALNGVILAVVHEATAAPAVLSQAIALVIVAAATFLSHKYFSFRRRTA